MFVGCSYTSEAQAQVHEWRCGKECLRKVQSVSQAAIKDHDGEKVPQWWKEAPCIRPTKETGKKAKNVIITDSCKRS